MNESYSLVVNGSEYRVACAAETPLLDVLRDHLGLPAAKFGCGEGLCGACVVLVDGVPVPSCDTPAWSAAGRAVTTVEGLGDDGERLRAAFAEHQAAQCGYCVSGVLVSAAALLRGGGGPRTENDIRCALDRHLCRCGAHVRMLRAVMQCAEQG